MTRPSGPRQRTARPAPLPARPPEGARAPRPRPAPTFGRARRGLQERGRGSAAALPRCGSGAREGGGSRRPGAPVSHPVSPGVPARNVAFWCPTTPGAVHSCDQFCGGLPCPASSPLAALKAFCLAVLPLCLTAACLEGSAKLSPPWPLSPWPSSHIPHVSSLVHARCPEDDVLVSVCLSPGCQWASLAAQSVGRPPRHLQSAWRTLLGL